MMYTNGSSVTKTFHGVVFQPGDTKDVSGIINDPTFVKSSVRKEPPKRSRRTQKAAKEPQETKDTEVAVETDSSDTESSETNKEV